MLRGFAAALLLAAGAVTPAAGHVVYGTPSLQELVRDADLVARVRVTSAHRLLRVEPTGRSRPVVDVVVLETLHGERHARATFVPHGHGAAEYHDGEEALVFLRRIERVPELAASPLVGRVRWVSLQETTDKIALGHHGRRIWVEAVRRYLAARSAADPATRQAKRREATIAHLASPEPRLAAAALRDLVRDGDALAVGPADVKRLEALLERDDVSPAVRVGILVELQRRGLVAGSPHWVRLLQSVRGPDALVVIRAAGAHPSPEVTSALLDILDGPSPEAAAAAAVSLGVPGNGRAVTGLARALDGDDPRLRFGAIRGLGRIGGDEAVATLEQAALAHPDPDTRRRARAEVTVLERRTALADGARPVSR